MFFVLGGVVGFVKAKVFKEEKYTSTALLFVDLNRDVIDTSNDMNESSKISMLANSFSQIVSSDSVIAPIAKQYALDSEDIDVENEDAVNTKVDNLRENITVTGSFSYHGGGDGGRRFERLFFQRTGRHSQHGRYFQCRFHHSIQRGQR